MFPYFEFCLSFVVAVYLFETFLDFRQLLKTREKKRPGAITSFVSEKKFLESQSYSFDKSAFGIFSDFCEEVKFVAVLVYGVFPFVWDLSGTWLAQLGGYDGEIAQSILFCNVLLIAQMLWGIPFSLFSSFVIEEKHGFNKQTIGLFITDTIKSLLLGIVFGSLLVGLLVKVIQWGGEQFYVWVWLFMLVFQLFMLWFYPNVIQPWFNKFEPLPEGSLKRRIESLAASIQFPLSKLYVIDGSRRSAHSNAYFYGFFKNKRIVLFDTLLKEVGENEILAVLSHELGHWKMSHVLKNLIIAEIHMFFLFFSFGWFINNAEMYSAFGFSTQPVLIGLLLFQLVFSPVEHVVGFLMNILSRRFEFQADAYAKKLGYASELKSGLIKLQLSNLGNMNPDPWYSTYHYSHPPLIERLKALGGGIPSAKPENPSHKENDAVVAKRNDEKPVSKAKTRAGAKNAPAKKANAKLKVQQQPAKAKQFQSSKPSGSSSSSKAANRPTAKQQQSQKQKSSGRQSSSSASTSRSGGSRIKALG